MSDFEIADFAVFVGLMGVAFTFFYVKIDFYEVLILYAYHSFLVNRLFIFTLKYISHNPEFLNVSL